MKHFLILLVTLCLGLSASPAVADGDSDYDENGDSDCPGNSCNAPPGQGGDSSSDAFAEAYSEAFAKAFLRSYIEAGGGEASATGTGTVTIGGDIFEPTDLSKRPGTPSSLGVDACGGGFSISAPGVGATGTKPSRFCHLLTLANVYQKVGESAISPITAANYFVVAAELREEARTNVKRRGRLTRALHLDELPIIGWLFFRD